MSTYDKLLNNQQLTNPTIQIKDHSVQHNEPNRGKERKSVLKLQNNRLMETFGAKTIKVGDRIESSNYNQT